MSIRSKVRDVEFMTQGTGCLWIIIAIIIGLTVLWDFITGLF